MKLLHVKWNQHEAVEYFVDKDPWSCAHEIGNLIQLDTCSGTYYFNKNSLVDGVATDGVSLDNGVMIKFTTVHSWTLTHQDYCNNIPNPE